MKTFTGSTSFGKSNPYPVSHPRGVRFFPIILLFPLLVNPFNESNGIQCRLKSCIEDRVAVKKATPGNGLYVRNSGKRPKLPMKKYSYLRTFA
jgi:hypothetical protein